MLKFGFDPSGNEGPEKVSGNVAINIYALYGHVLRLGYGMWIRKGNFS